jgi:hypothetical protein
MKELVMFPELTPNVIEAVKCWMFSNTMDTYGPDAFLDEVWFKAFEQESRLFTEFFPAFTTDEHETYRAFVKWLNNSGFWKSDLLIVELFEIFKDFY